MPYVSLSWLRDHVDVPEGLTVQELAESLVSVGFEEEEIHPPAVTGPLVVGRVLSVESETHANGKTVNYCRVDVGDLNDPAGAGKEPAAFPSRGIICGAHNFDVGDSVVVSLPGAVLPGPFPITARKTYGHVSDGMICSERELGLGEDHSGIIVLDRLFPSEEIPSPGSDVIGLLGLGEEVLEVNVTPDRGYALSVRGLAREYSHATGASFTDHGLADSLDAALPPHSPEGFSVVVAEGSQLEGRAACDRFVTQVVRGVDPKAPTPKWMLERLEQAGMRGISLPVDVTNYVMLDLGQPLHAYSLESVEPPFVVRRAAEGEPFTTLDGTQRVLDAEDLVITDSPDGLEGSRIVGLAGVMGGLDSEVGSQTVDVVIEGAHFDSVSIARTSRRHRLSSEASRRFERGVDPNLAPVAVNRVAQLLAEYGGGIVEPFCFDYDDASLPPAVRMRLSEPRRLTGVEYGEQRIVQILELIGATVDRDGDWLVVTPPSWRPDLTGPAHLVEEIARIDGYDRIGATVPSAQTSGGMSDAQRVRRQLADTLAQSGLVEVLSYPFVGDSHDRQLISGEDTRRQTVRLSNPLVEDTGQLRTSILDSLLDVASRNAARGNPSLGIFELGSVTVSAGVHPSGIPPVDSRPTDEALSALLAGVPDQPWHVAGVVAGPYGANTANSVGRDWDWLDAVGLANQAGAALGLPIEATRAWLPAGEKKIPGPPVPAAETDPGAVAPWHPGRVARLYVRRGKELVLLGLAGELHPRVTANFGLPGRAAAFELDLDVLVSLVSDKPVQAKKVSVYPAAKIDLALVADQSIPNRDFERVIRNSAGPSLESLQLFDVYSGPQVEAGSRSLAFALTLRAPDHTLTSEEVTKIREKVIHDVSKRLGAQLRA